MHEVWGEGGGDPYHGGGGGGWQHGTRNHIFTDIYPLNYPVLQANNTSYIDYLGVVFGNKALLNPY